MSKTLVLIFMMCSSFVLAQSINFDQLGKEKWLRYNGGISANGIYYDGTANRQPFTYYLNGNLNFNVGGVYNIPLSFSYSNQEFDFPNPFKFNRFSFHPSYKWVTGHFGDVAMTFSPYTLAGHQFTGAGLELNPEGKFKISAMYGRLLRPTEYNPEEPQAQTAYQRIGYGVKTAYEFDFAQFGAILFRAKDDMNSLNNPIPIEAGVQPKENTVVSLESNFKLFDKARLHIEYAISGITEDTRQTTARPTAGMLSFLLDENITTNYYNALNANLTYPAGKGTLGLGYERIDPEYKTLGAYFFNNDLENITINATQTLFNGKLNVAANVGLQQDNLDKSKNTQLQRIVSAFNVGLNASEKVSMNASYSNFQSYTNIRDQFDYINQVGQLDNVDTLNYRQISQNANFGLNVTTKKSETKQHNASINLVYQTSDNQQEGETIEGGKSSFYNAAIAHTWGFMPHQLKIALAGNVSYNTTGGIDDNMILGPTISIGKQFFDKRLRTNLSSSYNTSFTSGNQDNAVFNIRFNSGYTWLKKHNFNFSALYLTRNSSTSTGNDVTLSLGYTYTFDNFRLDLKWNKNERNKEERNYVSFRYRNVTYSGSIAEVNTQLSDVFKSEQFRFIPEKEKEALILDLTIVKKETKSGKYKEKALDFLAKLYDFKDFEELFNRSLFNAIRKTKAEFNQRDLNLEEDMVLAKSDLVSHPLHGKDSVGLQIEELKLLPAYRKLKLHHKDRLEKLVGYRWMQQDLEKYTNVYAVKGMEGHLKGFKDKFFIKAKETLEQSGDESILTAWIEREMNIYYYKKSLQLVDPEAFILKYTYKN
ncbi:porin family protein [Croceivirga radicis]|nr:hypothetical protein [Croceivirga radicis]